MTPAIPRAQWAARYGRGTPDPGPEAMVVIHHSFQPALKATDTQEVEASAVRGIEAYHVQTNGWAGIGYNWLVAPSGRVYEGRGWGYKGAHAGPVNGDSIGICLLIDGQKTPANAASIAAVRALIEEGLVQGEVALDYEVSGHRDHMAGRTCPGDKVYAQLPLFRHDAGPGHVAWPSAEVVTHPPKVAHPSDNDPPLDLDLKTIRALTPAHIDRAMRVRRLTPAQVQEGLELAELLFRGVVRGNDAAQVALLKKATDALADWIKGH